jgi:hypothetical protein
LDGAHKALKKRTIDVAPESPEESGTEPEGVGALKVLKMEEGKPCTQAINREV